MSISSGRVEVHKNGMWGTVCSRNFNQAAADSVCRQMGYTNAMDVYAAQLSFHLINSRLVLLQDVFRPHLPLFHIMLSLENSLY